MEKANKPDGNETGKKEEEPVGVRRRRYVKQVLLLLSASFGYSSVGMAIAWPNVFATHIVNDKSTIFNTELLLDDWQMDMLASTLYVGSIPGFLLAGWLVGRIGRRRSMLVGGLFTITGTFLIALTYNVYMLLIGRILDGVAFGMMGVALRSYVVEIADVKIRGAAAIMINLDMQVASLCMLTMGLSLNWYYVAMLSCGGMAFFCMVIVPFLPESPSYLAITNRESEALSVLSRLRCPYADLDGELEQLKKMNQTSDSCEKGYRGLMKPVIMKRLMVLFGLFMIANFSGVQVLKSNTVRILESSGLAMGKIMSTIMVTCTLFTGNFMMMLLVDRIGRRYCLIISLSILAVAYSTLGSYNFIMDSSYEETDIAINQLSTLGSNATVTYDSDIGSSLGRSWTWVPLLCLVMAALGQSMGAGPLPYVLAPEYFPTSLRSQGMSLCTMVGGLQAFAALQLFSPMQDLLTKGGTYWAYAATAMIGIPYTVFLIQETCGKLVG